ncbi:MAG: carboxypeptidase-like regulatory domain-containing protein [Ferruginibacter sp.]
MVTGQIVNEKGEPVPFATVQNKVSTVSSDAEGKFKLPVTDSLSVASVTATGYDSKMMYNINPKQQQTVVLNSNQQQLNEVVVSSSAVAKKKNLTKSVTNIAVNAPVEWMGAV